MATTVWKGQLGFGLVNMPVRLYRAARRERIRLHYLAPADHSRQPHQEEPRKNEDAGTAAPVSRVRQSFVSQAALSPAVLNPEEAERPIPRGNLLKGSEVAPDRYVTFTPQELRALRPETSPAMQIVRSVRLEEIDPVYFEISYYLVPDPAGQRAYSLLYMALKESGYVALATVAMHGREYAVVVRPGSKGLLAHTMYYVDEVRAEDEFAANLSGVVPKELQLAKAFVETISGPFAPEEFKDAQREKLEALISAKLAGNAVRPARTAPQSDAAPVDIMDALKKSIETSTKASVSETPVPRREPGRVTEIKSKPGDRRA